MDEKLSVIEDASSSSWGISYDLLAIICRIVGLGLSQDVSDERSPIWSETLVTLLSDIGAVYEMLDILQDEQNYGMPIMENPEINDQVKKLGERLKKISTLVNKWTPLLIKARTAMLCEEHWGKVLKSLQSEMISNPTVVAQMLANSKRRRVSFRQLAYQHKRRYNQSSSLYKPI